MRINVLERARREEVLLFQSQLPSFFTSSFGYKTLVIFSEVIFSCTGARVVADVERFKIKRVGRFRLPEPEAY